jgi:hypothetical protein
MGQVFGGGAPKGPDPAMVEAQNRQMQREESRAAALDAQEEARRRARTGRTQGRALLISGDETGLPGRLGGT